MARLRNIALSLFAGVLALVAAQGDARAQSKSTWDQIMETKTLRIGVPISEPWYFKDVSGKEDSGTVKSGSDVWRGVAPMLAKQIADAMGVKLEIVETTFANAVAGLQSNQFDFMLVLDPTPQRALSVDFSPIPVLYYPLGLLAPDNMTVNKWSDINDPKFRIGVALGSSQDQFISRAIPKATITRFQDNGAVIAAFQAGRIDAACLTGPTADIAHVRLKTGKTLLPKPINVVGTGAAFRKEPDRRWGDYLGTVIGYYYNTGKTQEIYDQFMAYRGLKIGQATGIMRENLSGQ